MISIFIITILNRNILFSQKDFLAQMILLGSKSVFVPARFLLEKAFLSYQSDHFVPASKNGTYRNGS